MVNVLETSHINIYYRQLRYLALVLVKQPCSHNIVLQYLAAFNITNIGAISIL